MRSWAWSKLFLFQIVFASACGRSPELTNIGSTQQELDGDHLWSRQFGDDSPRHGKSVAADIAGNVFLTGDYQRPFDFGGPPLGWAGGADVFLAKLSAAGSHVWSHGFGDSANQYGHSVATDRAGNVFIAGQFYGSINFGGSTTLVSQGLDDACVAKFDPAGNHVWSLRFGDRQHQSAFAAAVDSAGDVIVVGEFEGALDIGTDMQSAGGFDVFVAKLSGEDGTLRWARRFGDESDQSGLAVAVDGDDNVIIAGTFSAQSGVRFGDTPLRYVGGTDVFLAKLAGASGSHVWSTSFSLNRNDDQIAGGVAVDAQNNVLVTGGFAAGVVSPSGGIDFGGETFTPSGATDLFVAKFSSGGVRQWSRHFGDTSALHGRVEGRGVTADAFGNVLLTGWLEGSVAFLGDVLVSAGGRDIFIGIRTDRKPLDDKRVRQAISHAIDRDFIVQRLETCAFYQQTQNTCGIIQFRCVPTFFFLLIPWRKPIW